MHTLVLGQMLALLEALIAVATLVGLLAGMDAPMPLQVGGALEAPLTIGALKGLLTGRVATVLNKVGRREEASITKRTLERLLLAVRVLVALQGGALFVALATHIALVGFIGVVGAGG